MPSIVFRKVSKKYGKKEVLRNIDFEVHEGERMILLGPSGSGKSTILRMTAGFEDVTGGEIEMDGRVVNAVSPGERNIAMVFQSYALFPHMNVWDNIAFGLTIQKLNPEEIRRRVEKALDMLHLKGYEKALPKELSGGQKQRVALCRAVVKRSPYFLLDEPLSNLDAQLRQKARQELVRIHDMYHPAMIYVTHDQVEAMTVGQRIAVLHEGVLQQLASPEEIYRHPANTFVASFIGSPAMNLLPASLEDGRLAFGKYAMSLPSVLQQLAGERKQIIVGIRPENIRAVSGKNAMIGGRRTYLENTGNLCTMVMETEEGQRIFLQTSGNRMPDDSVSGVDFDWMDVCFFDNQTGYRLEG